MSKKRLPYMQFYTKTYLAATRRLSCLEHGLYCQLLFMMWENHGVLWFNEDDLAHETGLTREQFDACWINVKRYFEVKKGKLYNQKISESIKERKKLSELKENAANSRWSKNEPESSDLRDARALQNDANIEPEPTPESKPDSESKTTTLGDGKVVPIRANIRNLNLPENFPGASAHRVLVELVNSPWLDMSKSGGLQSPAEIARWVTQGCDWTLDVVPTVQAVMATCKRKISSWGYFTNAVFKARDTRLLAGPAVPVPAKPRRSPEDQALWQIWDDFGYWAKMDHPWPDSKPFPGFDRIREALEKYGKPDDIEILEASIQYHNERKAQ